MKHGKPETIEQISVVTYIRAQYPDILMTMSPAGVKFGGNPKQRMIQGANMKRMGYVTGTPDLILMEARGPWHGLLIEMKTQGGTACDVSPEQRAFHAIAERKGYRVEVCFGSNEAVNAVDRYMKWPINGQNQNKPTGG